MTDDVLVELWIPAARIHKDMYLPCQIPLQELMNVFEKLMPEIGASIFKIQSNTRLYRLDTLEELSPQLTCADYFIQQGETLLLL